MASAEIYLIRRSQLIKKEGDRHREIKKQAQSKEGHKPECSRSVRTSGARVEGAGSGDNRLVGKDRTLSSIE